jgi:hypothetical protein
MLTSSSSSKFASLPMVSAETRCATAAILDPTKTWNRFSLIFTFFCCFNSNNLV